MRPTLVVVPPPCANNFFCMNNIVKIVLIQAFIAKATIKTLDNAILCRLARLNKPQLNIMLKGQLIQRTTGKLRPLICSYRRRIATKQRNAVQNARYLNACNPESNADRQTLLREIINTGQAFNPATTGQRIHDKIH